jgi:hypothetical protein
MKPSLVFYLVFAAALLGILLDLLLQHAYGVGVTG